jgi:peroxiredoxin Q/BCP
VLEVGDKLPKLTLLDDEGHPVSTHDLLDGHLVLWFYPKDDTPGWTSEGGQFRDMLEQFNAKHARIVGVSRDSVESHQKFKIKYDFPFTLLADTDLELYEAMGVTQRSTFLIDDEGTIVHVWPKVKVEGHADEVLASLP